MPSVRRTTEQLRNQHIKQVTAAIKKAKPIEQFTEAQAQYARARLNLTPEEVAKAINVSVATAIRYEGWATGSFLDSPEDAEAMMRFRRFVNYGLNAEVYDPEAELARAQVEDEPAGVLNRAQATEWANLLKVHGIDAPRITPRELPDPTRRRQFRGENGSMTLATAVQAFNIEDLELWKEFEAASANDLPWLHEVGNKHDQFCRYTAFLDYCIDGPSESILGIPNKAPRPVPVKLVLEQHS